MISIIPAYTETSIHDAIALSQEYIAWLVASIQERYPDFDITGLIEEHDYDDIRKKFPGEHVPPFGRLYVAMSGSQAAGCIALGKMSDTVCEMRTLFVRPECRGMGVAKKLVETLLDDAREIGYTHMRLDTLPFMETALNYYRSLGFHDCAPYRDVSASLKRYICFLELDLRQS